MADRLLNSADDFAELAETLELLRTPGVVDAVQEGRDDAAARRFVDNDEIKIKYGLVV